VPKELKYINWTWAGGVEAGLAADRYRARRLLLMPALFDEANKLRRFTAEVMRQLDDREIDCLLPDLPGCNDSMALLASQTPSAWRAAMTAAAAEWGATHVLAIRGGALVAPALPGWALAPVKGASVLRQMLRARVLAAREAGCEESSEALLAEGITSGLELAGYALSAIFMNEFQSLEMETSSTIAIIEHSRLGGPGLWLRAEPGEDPAQAAALAALISEGMAA
jgi:hypothetical protein